MCVCVCVCFIVKWDINLLGLFNTKVILLEGQH